ncbi:acetolactate synthase large subunit [Paraburkholderia sp. J10-1]|uniref:acetolactate synthase large subunit n=1 Tax=Paraburkholderia sp. J10-1 TaxID=2805430 RepID=UPI002AB615F8|nr:acetolactate synthase large subunit [Paraburkholderia sp. J10-1]
MNGAKSLVETLLKSGVDTCFANPGTSEMHFVAALDQSPGMRCVLGLQENVVTGMADGYYRVSGKVACTLLHCGPGLANGMANLHNAYRARSGVVNIVGDQATYHRQYDAPLTAKTVAMAETVSQWVRSSSDSRKLGGDAAHAVAAALTTPGQIATLIVPSDTSWNEGGEVAAAVPVPQPPHVASAAIDAAARALEDNGGKTLILLSGKGALREGQALAARIASATGAHIMLDYTAPRVQRGEGALALERVPYATDRAVEVLGAYENIILVNANPPVAFFAYPDKPSIQYRPDAALLVLTQPDQNALEGLSRLADALDAPPVKLPSHGERAQVASGSPSPEKLAQTIAAVIPEHTIISDESVSYGRGFYAFSNAAPAHEWLHLVGGAIGDGLPIATGAAIGTGGEQRVVSIQADGAGMYSLQALWTQARERLPVTTIVISNRKYNILINEYKNVGAVAGETAMNMLSLADPDLDWVALANGLGVEAARAHDMETLADLMTASFRERKPFLIELIV